MQSSIRITLTIFGVGAGFLCGCGKQTVSHGREAEVDRTPARELPGVSAGAVVLSQQAASLDSTNVLRSFSARGVVRELPAGSQTVVVQHEAIPGFMPKMTMEFNLRNTNEVRGLRPGDVITFLVRANEDESWIENIQRSGSNPVAKVAPADPSSAALLRIAHLKPGDRLPDIELLTEGGDSIKLSHFEGSAVAFTFIFTRCPLPDFCPRMSTDFSRARELLRQQSGGPTNWQFLSLSFDPEFDQPGVLTRYAFSYRGANLDRWLFASAPTNVTAALAPLLDFRFANEGGSFLHNLRTVVLDPQRRVYRQFDGNRWKPEELAQALAEAASSSPPAALADPLAKRL